MNLLNDIITHRFSCIGACQIHLAMFGVEKGNSYKISLHTVHDRHIRVNIMIPNNHDINMDQTREINSYYFNEIGTDTIYETTVRILSDDLKFIKINCIFSNAFQGDFVMVKNLSVTPV